MQQFQAADGRLLAYEDSGGDGPAVLCLAGLSRNSRDFADLAGALVPRFRVIRLDSRGRGRSERAADPLAEYSVAVEAGDAIQLIDHLGIERLGLVGTSRGGILGMAIAAARPGLIAALVLNDVGAVVERRGLLRILASLGRAPQDAGFAEAALRLRDEHAESFPGVPLEEWERHARRIYDDEGGRPVLAFDPLLRDAVAAAMEGAEPAVSLWPLFEAVKALPVLLVHGENSDVLSRATVAAMAEAHAGLEALSLPDRGHAPFLNEPAAVIAIDGFLRRTLSPAVA